MRHVLKRREWLPDEWRYLGEDGAEEAGVALIVPLARWRAEPERWGA